MSEMQVVFTDQPLVGRPALFVANGQRMASSPVTFVNADPTRQGWFSVQTSSGNTYIGPLQMGYQPTTYPTHYAPPPVHVQVCAYPSRPVPPEIADGLNWGAFFFPLFWSIAHGVWIGLLCLVPAIGRVVMSLILLFRGNEWAWEHRQFRSIEQFRDVQRKWLIAGVVLFCCQVVTTVALFVLASAFVAALEGSLNLQ